MKLCLLVSAIIFLSGCEISQVEYMNEESDNIISEAVEDVITEEEKEYSEKNEESEQIILDSLYIEDANRNQYDNGEYLRLGDSISTYINNSEGGQELLQEVRVEDYFIIGVDDPEMEAERLDLHFVLKIEDFAVENIQYNHKATEVGATLFLGDINLGNYYPSALDEKGENIESYRRFNSQVTYDGKYKFSCNLSAGAEYEENKRVCTIAFSYAGSGEYLLVLSDKVGGFKNYLIEVE